MRNLIKSLKYFVTLCVLCVAIVGIMFLTNTSAMTFEQALTMNFFSQRGWLLLAAIVILSAFYPRFGFVARMTPGDMAEDRELIMKAFLLAHYALREERDGVILFRADNPVSRFFMLGEDAVEVRQMGDQIELKGIKRGVAKVEYRLKSYIESKNND